MSPLSTVVVSFTVIVKFPGAHNENAAVPLLVVCSSPDNTLELPSIVDVNIPLVNVLIELIALTCSVDTVLITFGVPSVFTKFIFI